MNILFLSEFGEGADIAFRMILDGHKVRVWINDAKMKEVADGLVQKIKDWTPSVSWADMAFFDYNSDTLSKIWERIHSSVPCFGGSPFGLKLEKDRPFAHAMMKKADLETIESLRFKTFPEVIAHLQEHKVPHFVKPSGKDIESHHVVNSNKADNSDLIAQIERFMSQGLKTDYIEVEEKKTGIEVGIDGFFNGMDWIYPINVNFEHKMSNEREIGYRTGEMGTLCKYLEDNEAPIFTKTLGKFTKVLRAFNYRGEIDLNMIVGRDHEKGIVHSPLEFTPRIGYPAFALESCLHITPWADLAYACATEQPLNFQVHYDWCVGVVLAAFGFPFQDKVEKISKGLVVEGIDENSIENIHPTNLAMDKKGRFVVSNGAGYLLTATGRGETIDLAKQRAYSNMSRVQVPNSFHRWDISDKIKEYDLSDLGIVPIEEGRPL